MYFENIVIDAVDPHHLGRFWLQLLDAEPLSDGPEGFEMRVRLGSDPGSGPDTASSRVSAARGTDPAPGTFLDVCLQPVPEPPTEPLRLHLDLLGGPAQAEVVEKALALGAEHLDIGQGDVPWVVLGDPEGNPFCVMEEREAYQATGPIAALPLDSADPARDQQFWAWLTGWMSVDGVADASLRHPSGRGPLLEMCAEPAAKRAADGKNRMHLDVRLEPGDDADAVAAAIIARGGAELHPDWGDLPWRVFTDPSGNEFCVLPAPSGA